MVLARMMNKHHEDKGRQAGLAEGKAVGQAATEARVQSWYDTHKDQMGDTPPPPVNSHRDTTTP